MKVMWYVIDLTTGRLLSSWEGEDREAPPRNAQTVYEAGYRGHRLVLAVGRYFHPPEVAY